MQLPSVALRLVLPRPQQARFGPSLLRLHSGESGRVALCFPRFPGRGPSLVEWLVETSNHVLVLAQALTGLAIGAALVISLHAAASLWAAASSRGGVAP